MLPSKSEIFNSTIIPFYSLNSHCVNLVLEPAGDSGHESRYSALAAEYIEFILYYLSFELEYSQHLSVSFYYPCMFPSGIWSTWPGRGFRCLVSWLWLAMWPPEISGLLIFVKIMFSFSMKTSQWAEPQQGPGSWQEMQLKGGRNGNHKHGMLLGRHPWGCVDAGISQNSAGRAELLQPEPGVTPEVPLNNGSAVPSLILSHSRAGSSPCSHVPTDEISSPVLSCWRWGNFSRFSFPWMESRVVPQLFQQLKRRKGMILSFPDIRRGF